MRKKVLLVGCILVLASILPVFSMEVKIKKNSTINNTTNVPVGATLRISHIIPKSIGKLHKAKGIPIDLNIKTTPRALDINVTPPTINANHPSVAADYGGDVLVAFDGGEEILTRDIYFFYSTDNGNSWSIGHHYEIEDTVEEYPAFDYWGQGKRFFGTFKPDPEDCSGVAMYIIDIGNITAPATYQAYGWDWSSFGYHDYDAPAISCYDGIKEWWLPVGVIVNTVDGTTDEGEEFENAACFNFPSVEENYYWIWVWYESFPNCAHAATDIDRSNGMWYGAWDWLNETTMSRDIIILKMDTHDLAAENWDAISIIYIQDEYNELTYPSIAASQNHVYVACQWDDFGNGNQEIYCYYSSDGGVTWNISVIAATPDDELFPTIVAYGKTVTCTFVRNGDLYVTHSTDGGVTWSEPEKINDREGSVEMDYRSTSLNNGGHIVWTDNTAENFEIYYENVGIPAAVISIEEIKGGFGVKATLKNIGELAGEDIPWSISLSGLVFIGGEKTGTIDLAPGETTTIKSGLVFGFGPTTITVNAGGTVASAQGFIIGPIVTIK